MVPGRPWTLGKAETAGAQGEGGTDVGQVGNTKEVEASWPFLLQPLHGPQNCLLETLALPKHIGEGKGLEKQFCITLKIPWKLDTTLREGAGV